jgi:gas vesicle protein
MSNEDKENIDGAQIAGDIWGNVSNASTIYGSDKFNTPRGHGFAAEQANHLYDKVTMGDFFGQGKVKLVGEDIDPETGHIVKNGADRVVNGVNIQTKYCSTGGKCIEECFENGKFRYFNPDGTPMQVEVPSDKYEAAVKAMRNRIEKGEVPGITNPEEAEKIVRKGHFTYEQVKNIAKAGTIESITFDAVNGAIIATGAFGISAAISFATSIWNEEQFDVAIKNATYTGLKVGGTTFITAVLAGQLSKAGLNSALVGSSEAIVSMMGPKASAMLVNAFRSGGNIYGAAAMKSAAKMLRGNAITGAVTVVVLSSADVVNIFRGRISGKQLFKNMANTATTVVGGTAGWVGGATVGASVGSAVPIIGTAIGGLIGGLVGSFAAGTAAGKATNAVLGAFIEDDAKEMVDIIEKTFQKMANDYLLNKKEAENVVNMLQKDLTGSTLKDMFASSDRKKYAKNLLIKYVEKEVGSRKKIILPTEEQMQESLRTVLEEMAGESELQFE